MNWEYIYKKLCEGAINHGSHLANEVKLVLSHELNDKIIIQKGEKRHRDADVLHQWVEGKELQWSYDGDKWHTRDQMSVYKYPYRIKPPKPVYEYKYFVGVFYGIDVITEGYLTEEEAEGLPIRKIESTKKERK